MTRLTGLLATVSLLVVVVSLAGVAGATGAVAEDPFGQMDIEADDVVMEASVEPNGDAVWTIEYRARLATDEEERAFEELREDVEADPDAYTDRFRDRMETTVAASADATGREMSVSDVSVSAERRDLPREYGILTYEFRWTGFAVADGSRITAGDALEGLFLDDETAFILSWPDTHHLVDATPSPTETRDHSVVWVGPIEFTGEEPRVTVDSEATGADGDGSDGGDGVTMSSWVVGLGLGVLLLALAVAILAYRRRDSLLDGSEGGSSSAASTPESTGSAVSKSESVESDGAAPAEQSVPEDESESSTNAESGPDAGAGAEVQPDAGSEPAEESEGAAGIDADLLSNEEQVLRLIEEHGGRMKQAQVVEELDWTAAKTSQVVTGLRDDDELDGFRLGRENVLSLPDNEE